MRKSFAKSLHVEMRSNPDLYLLTGDLGFGLFDNIKNESSQFCNVGSAEQLLVGAGIGLAIAGKIPICYSITPFLLYRPFELIRNYINHENIPVKLVGSGRGKDYDHDGFTHWAEDDLKILDSFPNIQIYVPENIVELNNVFNEFLYNGRPSYLNLTRSSA